MRKFLPKILILLVIFAGVGFLDSVKTADAAGICIDVNGNRTTKTKEECSPSIGEHWEESTGATGVCFDANGAATNKTKDKCDPTIGEHWDNNAQAVAQTSAVYKSDFEAQINLGCTSLITGSGFKGCMLQLFYWMWHDIPAWVLIQVAYLFNVMLSIAMDGRLFKSGFVASGWAIVRDLSNIFFILILLYVAIRMILGLAGHGVKETVAKVVIVALLINFSMFFTGIVIDTSNMLALVFYNKLKVSTTVDGSERPYASVRGEKDVSGGLVAAFDPTRALHEDFFKEARKTYGIDGQLVEGQVVGLPFGTTMAIIFISGVMMLFAVYALFVSGFAFLARLIELWLLIIASPFAFMSSTVHEMEGLKDWGWKSWLHRLIAASFMAPAFMFFLYFIFLLISSNVFTTMVKPLAPGENDAAGVMKMLLGIALPLMLILTLLLKSVKLAKAGAGQFGETIMGLGAKLGGLATGLAVGAATGGASLAGTALIGGAGGAGLGKLADKAKEGGFARTATFLQDSQKFVRERSFDLRNVKIAGKSLGSATGLDVGKGNSGGWNQSKREQQAKRQARADELRKREAGTKEKDIDVAKTNLHHKEEEFESVERKLQLNNLSAKQELERLEKEMTKARQELNDAKLADDGSDESKDRVRGWYEELQKAKKTKEDFKKNSGIKDAEDAKNKAKAAVELVEHQAEHAAQKVANIYAEEITKGYRKAISFIGNMGVYSGNWDEEAARKIKGHIRMEAGSGKKKKEDDHGGGHGGGGGHKKDDHKPSGGGAKAPDDHGGAPKH
jgi:hypothetical protein